MSEVTDAPARTDASSTKRPLQGSHIWYELMTTDPDAAQAFYGKVVPGWSIGESIPGEQDYRMIERSDGGFAGGVFGLKQEQLDHGARPAWLGYVVIRAGLRTLVIWYARTARVVTVRVVRVALR